MNKQMLEVMQHRGELLARIASQREQVAEMGARWRTPLAIADQGLAIMRFLRANPVLVAAVVAIFVIRRRGVVGLMLGTWRVWKGYRAMEVFSARLTSRS